MQNESINSKPTYSNKLLPINSLSSPILEKDTFGVDTLKSDIFNVTYHSIHGVFQEAQHVYMEMGMYKALLNKSQINILEIGFGSGLNALITALEIRKIANAKINYTSVEAYPISTETASLLNYPILLSTVYNIPHHYISNLLLQMHASHNREIVEIDANFSFQKLIMHFESINEENTYDVIYFDAFAPTAQPELWTIEIFNIMFKSLKPGGILTTYCAKGQVRRNMQAAGFVVERLPGPPRKREMLRATKLVETAP